MKEKLSLEQLVIMAKQGDVGARERILNKFNPLLINNIMKYFGKNQDFQDWVQEGRLVILFAINNYNDEFCVPFAAYVQKQIFYYYINERKKIREEVILNQPLYAGMESLVDRLTNNEKVDEVIINIEENKFLYNAIANLSKKQREIIIEYYFNKKSLKSMAMDKNLCYQSLIKLKARALAKLKQELQT